MERSDYVRKGKRKVEGEEQQPKRNRKVLARCSTKQMPDQPQLQLRFKSTLSLPLFTEKTVEGTQGVAIHVELVDGTTGCIVTSGPESSVKLDAVVLQGHFDNDDDEDWTQEEFQTHEVEQRDGKGPLLRGDLRVKLKKGVGTLGSLCITDNSSWVRSKKFRIGLKVAAGHCEGIRIREAKTEAFVVKDRRGESYQKHYPPTLDDKVWRLDKIRKDGPFCKSLEDDGICTVRQLLRRLARDPKNLRDILGSNMRKKMWEALVGHAKTTRDLDEKMHVYYLNDSRTLGIIFNDVFESKGLIVDAMYYPADSLSCNQKVSMDDQVKKAYDDWEHILECDGSAIRNFKQNATDSQTAPDDTTNLQFSTPCSPIPIKQEGPTVEADLPPAGTSCYENPTAGYLMHTPPNCFQFDGTSSPLQNQPMSTSHRNQISRNDSMGELAPVSPHSSISGFDHEFLSNLLNDIASNDVGSGELAQGSPQLIISDDEFLSNLLNNFASNDVGFGELGSPSNLHNNLFDTTANGDYLSSQQNCSQYDEGGMCSPRKVVPWLKLKAVIMWRVCLREILAKKAREGLALFSPLSDTP